MKQFLIICATLSTVVLIMLTISVNPNKSSDIQVQAADYQKENEKIDFLENLVVHHPTYFDGYIELTGLYLKIGNYALASQSLERARGIHPNSMEVKNLEELLTKIN